MSGPGFDFMAALKKAMAAEAGPVRASNEIPSAHAASGEARTLAGRPAVAVLPELGACPACKSPTILSDDARLESCRDLMCGWRQWRTPSTTLAGKETPAEHIRNALQLLWGWEYTHVVDAVDGKWHIVYDADVVAAVQVRLKTALAGL